MHDTLKIHTQGIGLTEITQDVAALLPAASGLMTLFIRHTSASLLIQENADPDVQTDLLHFFSRLIPPADHPDMAYLTHICEGPDDMPAHIKASLLPSMLQIPVIKGKMRLGTWQGLYLMEHRAQPHIRQIAVHFAKDTI